VVFFGLQPTRKVIYLLYSKKRIKLLHKTLKLFVYDQFPSFTPQTTETYTYPYSLFLNTYCFRFFSIIMAMQSPSSTFSYGFTYQVFLSFRGSDTRYGFTGNLYKALTDKGIHTFIDDNHLPRGNEITPSLIKAIEESRIFIPIFSTNYASSSFCLDELVHIIHCYKTKGRLVLPVFFGVHPTSMRHHTGSYGEALAEHEKRFQNDKDNMERLQRWKMAIRQVSNLSGYHFTLGYPTLHKSYFSFLYFLAYCLNVVVIVVYLLTYLSGHE